MKIVALNVPQIFLKNKKIIEPRKSRVGLVLELSLSSFVSLEPARVIADDRVAGDLYNPVQSRGWMAADGGKKTKRSVSLMHESSESCSLVYLNAWFTWKKTSSFLGRLPSCGYQRSFSLGSSSHRAAAPTPPVGPSWKAAGGWRGKRVTAGETLKIPPNEEVKE